MKRRTFCGSAFAAVAASALPFNRLLAAAAEAAKGVDVPAVTGSGKQIILTAGDIADFRASLRGQVLLATDDGYEQARKVWNGAFDRRPALIARCSGAADVMSAVNFGRAHDLLLAVRGGGHSISGQSVCDGGLMIDLSPMKSIRVDPVSRTARLEPGVLLGQFDREAQAFGLATTAGTVSHTGAAGLTLGGGFGRIGRKFGLACDNLTAVDIVPANGRFLEASAEQNSDLLWGLRGGGGNFGVVTSFEYRLHEVGPTMLGGVLLYPLDQAREVLGFFADFVLEAPNEFYGDSFMISTPDGAKMLVLDLCYCGDIEQGQRVIAPLRQFRKPLQDGVGPTTYVRLQSSSDDSFPVGRSYYIKSGFLRRIDPKLIDALVEHFSSSPLRSTFIAFAHTGGEISRVQPDATAFWHREAQHNLLVGGTWTAAADRDANVEWARAVWAVAEPFTRGFYFNDLTPEDRQQRVRENYGGNYDRLIALKNNYDPTNLFRMNANVPPKS